MRTEQEEILVIKKSWDEAIKTIGDAVRVAQNTAYCMGYNRAMDEMEMAKQQAEGKDK